MSDALLEFECRVPVDGYRVLYFDESKFLDAVVAPEDSAVLDPDDWFVSPPADATEDELHLLRRWGDRIVPWARSPEWREGFFEATSYFWEPQVQAFLEPLSEDVRRFDLFEEASSPYVDFVNMNMRIGDVEGPKVLADRFGPLFEGPQKVDDWTWAIKGLRRALKAWKKAEQTNDFKPLIRGFSRKGFKLRGRNRVDASISLREVNGEARICVRPETLLDALWTQIAQAIDGSESLRTCVECKQWFTIKSGEGRSDKEYCSNACRMRAYRKRKGAAN